MTKPDFSKVFALNGETLPLSDSQVLQGFAYLGGNPPTKEEFNWLFQQVWLGMKWLDENGTGTSSGGRFLDGGNAASTYVISSFDGGGAGG